MSRAGRDARPLAERLAGRPAQPDEVEFNADIPHLGSGALRVERRRLQLAVLLAERQDAWTLRRLVAVTAELEGRRARR